MNLQRGTVLKSTGSLSGTVFEGVQILIVEHNEKGAVGFILNKPFGRNLNDLAEFSHLLPFELYYGGPVDGEHLYFIHQRPELIQEGVAIRTGLFWGGDFSQVTNGIQQGRITTQDVKIFVGYCGWDTGELEAEIEEGSWIIDTNADSIF